MQKMEDNSIDFVVTDPPYGLNFMGKNWDNTVPNKDIWNEAYRICKPGSMLAAFGGSRTHHHLMCAIEQVGWEIRDVIMWIYGSGFPKSHNKFGLEGYGTALKPAYEPIIIAMKPLEGTFAQNAEKWGVGGINIDESRIPINKLIGREKYANTIQKTSGIDFHGNKTESQSTPLYNYEKGRWPANLILSEESAAELDKMTGVNKSSKIKIGGTPRKTEGFVCNGSPDRSNSLMNYGDSGGASRFFYCAKASSSERNRGLEGMPLKQSNPNFGSGGFSRPTDQPERETKPTANFHPTVKPISLMKYIIKLLAPPGNPICLDPFMGSGSTGVACKELGIDFIGIEKEKEYIEIAQKRIDAAKNDSQMELFK